MNPTPTPPTSAPASQPVVDFIRGQRQNAAFLFLGLSVAFLIGTFYLGYRAFKTPAAAADKPAETKTLDPENPPLETPKVELSSLNRNSFMLGWIATLFGFFVTALSGVYLQVMPPKPSVELQLTESRIVLLACGGLLGCAMIVFGGVYFYLWSDSLAKWLGKNEWVEAKWVIGPIFGIVCGAFLVFLSVQPARSEERNNLNLRRLVYGSNLGVTVLLLLVVLVVANVVIVLQVPNTLDTTTSGFYTLSETTKNFLGKLGEPVTAYVIMPDSGGRESNDIRQFVYSAADSSEGKLTAKFVSPVTNKLDLQRLQEKYPRLSRDAYGILLTTGEDEKRNAFIPIDDLFDIDQRTGAPKAFAGEGKVMKELRFLADNEQKPVVYFTQSNGELAITKSPGIESVGGSAEKLKAFLETAYIDVRPLVFPLKNPSVPEDAAVVVVAEPQSPFSPDAANALRRYMNPSNPTARKGKLIVLSGASPGQNEKGMNKTGLEGLLAEFNVRLGDKFIYSIPMEQNPNPKYTLAGFTQSSAQNPISQTVGQAGRVFRFPMPREVSPVQGGAPNFKADALMITLPGRFTWVEDDQIVNMETSLRDLMENEAVATRKQVSRSPRSLAVIVTESAGNPHGGPPAGGAGRLLVIGNSQVFSDLVADKARSTPPTFDMIGVGIDWLRDRPPLATTIEAKAYKEYQFPEPAAMDSTRLLYLPFGIAMLSIIGLGTGVWIIRRK